MTIMKKITELFILMPLALALIFAMNYALAKAGEPRALWLMQIIGVM